MNPKPKLTAVELARLTTLLEANLVQAVQETAQALGIDPNLLWADAAYFTRHMANKVAD